MNIRAKRDDDNIALVDSWTERWGATIVVARGRAYNVLELPGFVAEADGALMGALTFARLHGEIEIVTLDSFSENKGIGTALLDAAVALGRSEGVRRLCLVTSNDNIRALRFYQRRGWRLSALYPGAIDAARRIKPEIPLIGEHDIPLRDEIEFSLGVED